MGGKLLSNQKKLTSPQQRFNHFLQTTNQKSKTIQNKLKSPLHIYYQQLSCTFYSVCTNSLPQLLKNKKQKSCEKPSKGGAKQTTKLKKEQHTWRQEVMTSHCIKHDWGDEAQCFKLSVDFGSCVWEESDHSQDTNNKDHENVHTSKIHIEVSWCDKNTTRLFGKSTPV